MKVSGFPGYEVEVDHVDRQEWSEMLREFDDATIIQAWSFAEVICVGQQVSRLVLSRDGEVVGLAQVRIKSLPLVGRGVAHLAWGPLWCRRGLPADPRHLAALLAALREEYVERRRLLLRIVPRIARDEGGEVERQLEQAGFIRNARTADRMTIFKDISAPLNEVRDSLDKNWRYFLRRAERNGLELRQGVSADHYRELIPIYQELLQRKKLRADVDVERWMHLQEVLPDREKPQVILVCHDRQAVAGLVVSIMGNTGFPIVAATRKQGLTLYASYLMHWRALEWAKGQGCTWYDLAGIDPVKTPGTYQFKKGFKGREVTLLGQFEQCCDPLSSLLVRVAEPLRELTRRVAGGRSVEA